MARFSDYVDNGYLPGEVRRSSYGDVSPFSILNYELNKRVKFKPESDVAGKFMKEFSALSSGPDYLINSAVKLPSNFEQMMSFLQAFSGSR